MFTKNTTMGGSAHCCCNWADCHKFQLELSCAYNARGVPTEEERRLVGNLIQIRVKSSEFSSAARAESKSSTKKKLLVQRFVKHIGMSKERLQVFSAGSVDGFSSGKTISFFVARHHFHESLLAGRITSLLTAEEAKKANIYHASDEFPTRNGKNKLFLRVPNVTSNQLRETIKSLISPRSERRQFRNQQHKKMTPRGAPLLTATEGEENMLNGRQGAVSGATATGTLPVVGSDKPPPVQQKSSSSMPCSFIYRGNTPNCCGLRWFHGRIQYQCRRKLLDKQWNVRSGS